MAISDFAGGVFQRPQIVVCRSPATELQCCGFSDTESTSATSSQLFALSEPSTPSVAAAPRSAMSGFFPPAAATSADAALTALTDIEFVADFTCFEGLEALQLRYCLIRPQLQDSLRPRCYSYLFRQTQQQRALERMTFSASDEMSGVLGGMVNAWADLFDYSAISTVEEPLLVFSLLTQAELADLPTFYARCFANDEAMQRRLPTIYYLFYCVDATPEAVFSLPCGTFRMQTASSSQHRNDSDKTPTESSSASTSSVSNANCLIDSNSARLFVVPAMTSDALQRWFITHVAAAIYYRLVANSILNTPPLTPMTPMTPLTPQTPSQRMLCDMYNPSLPSINFSQPQQTPRSVSSYRTLNNFSDRQISMCDAGEYQRFGHKTYKMITTDPQLLRQLIISIQASSYYSAELQTTISGYILQINEKATQYEQYIKDSFCLTERAPNKIIGKFKQMLKEDARIEQIFENQRIYEFKYCDNVIKTFDNFMASEYYAVDSVKVLPNPLMFAQSIDNFVLSPKLIKQLEGSQLFFASRAFYFFIQIQQPHLAFMVHNDIRKQCQAAEQGQMTSVLNDYMLCFQLILVFFTLRDKESIKTLFFDYFFNEKTIQKLQGKASLSYTFVFSDLSNLVERTIVKGFDTLEQVLSGSQCDSFLRERGKSICYEQLVFNLILLVELQLYLAKDLRENRYFVDLLRYAANGQQIWTMHQRLVSYRCYITPCSPLDAVMLQAQIALLKMEGEMNPLMEINNILQVFTALKIDHAKLYMVNARAKLLASRYNNNMQTNQRLYSRYVKTSAVPRIFHYLAHDMVVYNKTSNLVTKILNLAESSYNMQVDQQILDVIYQRLDEIAPELRALFFAIEFMPQKNIITQNKLFQNCKQQFDSAIVEQSSRPTLRWLEEPSSCSRYNFNYVLQNEVHSAIQGKLFKSMQISSDDYSLTQFYIMYMANMFMGMLSEIPADRLLVYYYDILVFREIKMGAGHQAEVVRMRKLLSEIFTSGYQKVLQTRIYKDERFYIYISIFNPNICDVLVRHITPLCEGIDEIRVRELEAITIPPKTAGIVLLNCELPEYKDQRFTITGYRISYKPALVESTLSVDVPLHNPNSVVSSESSPLTVEITAEREYDCLYENELVLLHALFSMKSGKSVVVLFKTSAQEDMIILDSTIDRVPFCDIDCKGVNSLDDIQFYFTLQGQRQIDFRLRANSSNRFIIYTLCDGLGQAFIYNYRTKPSNMALKLYTANSGNEFYQAAIREGAKLFSQMPKLSEDMIQKFWASRRRYSFLEDINGAQEIGIPNGCVHQIGNIIVYYMLASEKLYRLGSPDLQQRQLAFYQDILRGRSGFQRFLYAMFQMEEDRFVLNYQTLE